MPVRGLSNPFRALPAQPPASDARYIGVVGRRRLACRKEHVIIVDILVGSRICSLEKEYSALSDELWSEAGFRADIAPAQMSAVGQKAAGVAVYCVSLRCGVKLRCPSRRYLGRYRIVEPLLPFNWGTRLRTIWHIRSPGLTVKRLSGEVYYYTPISPR